MGEPTYRVIRGDCLKVLAKLDGHFDTIFADPPDNLGLKYDAYKDKVSDDAYADLLTAWLEAFTNRASTVWFSFYPTHIPVMGAVVRDLVKRCEGELAFKACVQTFTFGQHNHHDLAVSHRPLYRLRWQDAPLFPDRIRIASWRQLNGDKRADPRGRVPGDHFDFPRVTGNSKQRRPWHPTQLHEDMVERCLKLSTPTGGSVFSPFGGTGTDLRVSKRLGFSCTVADVSAHYCKKIREENNVA